MLLLLLLLLLLVIRITARDCSLLYNLRLLLLLGPDLEGLRTDGVGVGVRVLRLAAAEGGRHGGQVNGHTRRHHRPHGGKQVVSSPRFGFYALRRPCCPRCRREFLAEA